MLHIYLNSNFIYCCIIKFIICCCINFNGSAASLILIFTFVVWNSDIMVLGIKFYSIKFIINNQTLSYLSNLCVYILMQFVKNNLLQHYWYQHNKECKTPEEIFNETHMDLVREGGKWLKSTSNSCSVVTTLITTVVFLASTTVPGGINDSSGMPILVYQKEFGKILLNYY